MDRGLVGQEGESFRIGSSEGSGDFPKAEVLDRLELVHEGDSWVVWVEPQLGAVCHDWDDTGFEEKAKVVLVDACYGVPQARQT